MLNYDKDLEELMNCVRNEMNEEYHKKIESELSNQDNYLTEVRQADVPREPRKPLGDCTKDIARSLGVDPEWLWLEDAIFSNEDQNPALVDVYKPVHWWDDTETLVLPESTPDPEDRVERYLKESRDD
jgi:hypothetical protein